MFTINFFHRHVDHENCTNGMIYQEGFSLRNIKTRRKIKHSKMGQNRLIKKNSNIHGESVRIQNHETV